MIHYQLRCAGGHEFDGWFSDSAAFDAQAKAGFVECPTCGATEVNKRLMAPAIPKKGAAERAALVAGAFSVSRRGAARVSGRRVLLGTT